MDTTVDLLLPNTTTEKIKPTRRERLVEVMITYNKLTAANTFRMRMYATNIIWKCC